MENLKLTIQETQELLLMSQSSVYSWIDRGKLQTMDGPGGKIVVISAKEANQIRELNQKSKRNRASKQIASKANSQEIPVINAEILGNEQDPVQHKHPENVTLRLISELKELAIEAGKYKQLEIIRNEEKENAKFWNEKFLEVNSQLMQKNLEIEALKKQIEELKALADKRKGLLSFFNK